MGLTIKLAAIGAVAFMVLDGVWLGRADEEFLPRSARADRPPRQRRHRAQLAGRARRLCPARDRHRALRDPARVDAYRPPPPSAPCSDWSSTASTTSPTIRRCASGRWCSTLADVAWGAVASAAVRGRPCGSWCGEEERRSRPGRARYPIRAVSRLTGISIDTLRAWERRYGAVTPDPRRARADVHGCRRRSPAAAAAGA